MPKNNKSSKSILSSKTIAPKKDIIYGSKKNKQGSAKDIKSAKAIDFSESTLNSIKKKVYGHNKKNPSKKVTLSTAKAVVRRGMGAYSSSHRPIITGGKINSRVAWGLARLNAFLYKIVNGKSKSGKYSQDNDLIKEMGYKVQPFSDGGEINEDAQQLIDIISMNPEVYKKYKQVLKDKHNIDFDAIYQDEKLINNATLDDIKKQEDFFNFYNWLKYAKIISSKRGFIKHDLYFTSTNIMTDEVWNKMADKLNFSVEKIEYVESGTKGGDVARAFADKITYTKEADLYYFLHELGHIYDFQNKLKNDKIIKNPAYSPTNYGTTNAGETFAENFAIYFINPTALKDWNKEVYEAMDTEINDKYKKELNDLLKDSKKYAEGGEIKKDNSAFIDFMKKNHGSENPIFRSEMDGKQISIAEKLVKKGLLNKGHSDGKKVIYYMDKPSWWYSESFYEGGEIKNVIALPDTYSSYDTLKKVLNLQGYDINKTNDEVKCENCGHSWDIKDSDENDKYICHKCGHDNETSYIMSKLKNTKSISQIAEIHGVPESELSIQLQKGISVEMEHTTDKKIAEIIALHHLEEMPDYYTKLEVMENGIKIDKNSYNEEVMEAGGVVVGKRHSEADEYGTGERFLVESTGQVVEVEGGEGVLCPDSMQSKKTFKFDGKSMTGREIASLLNHKYGGVEFAKGGDVGHVCGCKKFYHGGELPSATLDQLKGGEAVVTVKTMESKDQYDFNGRKRTPRQILSEINHAAGGKKFEDGGIIDLSKYHFDNLLKMTKMVFFTESVLHK